MLWLVLFFAAGLKIQTKTALININSKCTCCSLFLLISWLEDSRKWFDCIRRSVSDGNEGWSGAAGVVHNWTVPCPCVGQCLHDFCLCSWSSLFKRERKVILEVEFSRRVTGKKQPLWKALGRAGTEVIRAVQLERDRDVAAKGATQRT